MYTSLDRVDIVTRNKETGRAGYVLTDHRSRAEIEAEPELSVLFAMTRVLAAGMMGARESQGADILYACSQAPPDFLTEAVSSAGGRMTVAMSDAAPAAATRDLGEIADAAFRGLAERVRVEHGRPLDEALLKRLEDGTLKSRPDKEEDEITYWTRIHELAAVCGELLRAKTNGRWMRARDNDSLFPFVFTAGDSSFCVADKAQRLLDQGESQRPAQLLRVADDVGRGEEGPLMLNLKPGDFPRSRGVCRELLEGNAGPGGKRLPLVFVGRDQPNTFAYLSAGEPDTDRRFDEALANLAALDLPAEEHDIAGVKVLVVSGHFYAAEKILDQAFLRTLHRRLGSELLAAAIPYKGLLLITGEVVPPGIVTFALIAQTQHEKSEGAPPLSPVVFLVTDGKVVGHLDTSAKGGGSPPPSEKKGFWGRLFGH
jgi:hypothetical protein